MGQRVNQCSKLKFTQAKLMWTHITELHWLDPKPGDLIMDRLKIALARVSRPNPRMLQNAGMICD